MKCYKHNREQCPKCRPRGTVPSASDDSFTYIPTTPTFDIFDNSPSVDSSPTSDFDSGGGDFGGGGSSGDF